MFSVWALGVSCTELWSSNSCTDVTSMYQLIWQQPSEFPDLVLGKFMQTHDPTNYNKLHGFVSCLHFSKSTFSLGNARTMTLSVGKRIRFIHRPRK